MLLQLQIKNTLDKFVIRTNFMTDSKVNERLSENFAEAQTFKNAYPGLRQLQPS